MCPNMDVVLLWQCVRSTGGSDAADDFYMYKGREQREDVIMENQ